jgi:hypothetical protein
MKNIHLLPTDKPSRLLYFGTSKELTLQVNPATFRVFERSTQNIYITSDEEIKEGDWYLIEFNGLKITQCTSTEELISIEGRNDCKKIILTTDQDLIKDGVQAIDDEFLEWFVKNPSCEEVDVKDITTIPALQLGSPNGHLMYKIIIPQEETKNPNNQEIMFHEEYKEYFYEDFVDGKFVTVWLGKDYIPQEEPKQYPIGGYAPGNYTCTCVSCKTRFQGDKRAVQCETCAIEMVKLKIKTNDNGGIQIDKQETLEDESKID